MVAPPKMQSNFSRLTCGSWTGKVPGKPKVNRGTLAKSRQMQMIGVMARRKVATPETFLSSWHS